MLLGAAFMLSVDFSILNVALPQVGEGVGMPVAALAWITSAFALPAAGFTLLFGRLGDLFGLRTLFLCGMVLLAAGSLLGGFSLNPETLVTARVLQGLATAMTVPAALSLLTTTFREGALRERVLGLNGALASGGFTVGAMVGGLLASFIGWRAAFFMNVPIALLVVAATPFVVPEFRAHHRANLDVPGALAVTGGLLALIYGVLEKNPLAAAVGAALLASFCVIELWSPAPLIPVRVLRRSTVRWGNGAGFVIFFMEPAMIFLMTLYLQRVLGLSPLATGLVFGVPGLAAVLAGPVAGRLLARLEHRTVLTAGIAVQGVATIPLILLGADSSALAVLIPALFVGFFGHVASIVAYTVTATSGLPDDEQGSASGLASMTQQVAITVGIPILSAIAATQASTLSGIHVALSVNVALTLSTALLVWFGLRPRADSAGAGSGGRSPVAADSRPEESAPWPGG